MQHLDDTNHKIYDKSANSIVETPLQDTIVVIGGCGFLGSWIVEQLIREKDCQVVIFDQKIVEPTWLKCKDFASIRIVKVDICDGIQLRLELQKVKPTTVIHTASPVHNSCLDLQYLVNVQGTENVVTSCKENNIKRLVYTSSAGVVFTGQDLLNADESIEMPHKHMDMYNETKAKAENIVLRANCQDFATCALRIAAIFGPGDKQLLPGMAKMLIKGQANLQIGKNQNLFDFTFVENAARAHVLAAKGLSNPEFSTNIAGQAFFITNGQVLYFWDFFRAFWAKLGYISEKPWVLNKQLGYYAAFIVEILSQLLGKEPTLTRYNVQYCCANRYLNITKAYKYLQYEPLVDLEDGLAQSAAWILQEKEFCKSKKLQ